MLKDDDFIKLKSLLESEHQWPSEYHFKFIVPSESVPQVEALFPNIDCQKKNSQKGKYTSLTISIVLDSADHVIAIYQKASTIKGLLSL
ncbi:MAG: DUF493 domain-containing protein [Bdellovibrionaceae bacterium]|jgi:uncharacterized protein|nr:DUF493 domain-containing protein [Pseudobdellovibrionaceae bacterium]